jgi:hypothetical protein
MSEWAGDREGGIDAEAGHGKRVGWVELYFDLVFVFVVSQVVHAVVAEPAWSRVAAALGVFTTLWWTWIGFAVLYNRVGDDTRVADRLFVLAGTVPCAVAATQVHDVFEGHPAGFALALAGARLVLAAAHAVSARGVPEVRRIGWGTRSPPSCSPPPRSPGTRPGTGCGRSRSCRRRGSCSSGRAAAGAGGAGTGTPAPGRSGGRGARCCATCSCRRATRTRRSTPGTWPSASASS